MQALPKALLVGIDKDGKNDWPIEDALFELKELCRTRGIDVIGTSIQKRENPHPRLYIGTGKLEEIKEIVREQDIKLIVTDDELTPIQNKNLESELEIKVIDRTGLILEIFSLHARTHESQLQIELAQLNYLLPRLTRLWTHLSRQTGGIGTKGPGETQLEVDKRQIRKRISTVKEKLEKIEISHEVSRSKRQQMPFITISIVGYTNAGKSTLLNTLTTADVFAENQLFATLDSTTRQLKLSTNETVLLSDTVGFIQKLPHQLVSSFKTTLKEASSADILLHVVDLSHPRFLDMIRVTNETLKELGADNIPQILVFNKSDAVLNPEALSGTLEKFTPYVLISALKNKNIDTLLTTIQNCLKENRITKTLSLPYSKMDVVHLLHQYGRVIEEKYEEMIQITVEINKIVLEKIVGQNLRESESKDR